jgi:hypothetical protein
MVYHLPIGKTCLDEVQDIVRMPANDAKNSARRDNHDCSIVDVAVMKQLRTFVAEIAGRYLKNPFHNFGTLNFCMLSMRLRCCFALLALTSVPIDLAPYSRTRMSCVNVVQEALNPCCYSRAFRRALETTQAKKGPGRRCQPYP